MRSPFMPYNEVYIIYVTLLKKGKISIEEVYFEFTLKKG